MKSEILFKTKKGKLKTRSFDDKEGNKKTVTEIQAEQLILLDKKTQD